MAGTMNYPRTASSASSYESRAGPTPAVNQLAEYLRLVTPNFPLFSGEPDTMTFEEWEMLAISWMDTHQVPEDFRVQIAGLQLRGYALYYWDFRRNQLGGDISWHRFSESMVVRFRDSGRLTRWRYNVARFYQHTGENVQDYGACFETQIVATHPTRQMEGLHQMIVYSMGLQPYRRVSYLSGPFENVAAMRAAQEAFDDRVFLPYGFVAAPAPEPAVAPAPEPAPVPAPVPAPEPVPIPVPAPEPEDQVVPELPEDDFLLVPGSPAGVIIISDDDSVTDVDMDEDIRLASDDSEYDPYLDG